MDALRTAQSSLAIQSTLAGLASTNVTRADEAHYARREAPTTTDHHGASITRVRRAQDEALARARLDAGSDAAGARTKVEALRTLRALHGGPDAESAPVRLVSELRTALQAHAAEPGSRPAAEAAIDRARSLADGLNAIAAGTARVREETDAALATDVDALNRLLARFGEENAAVVTASRVGRDGSDALDARARTLAEIGELMGVRTLEREHGDLVLLAATPGQPVVFDTIARSASFERPGALGPEASVTLDGIALDASVGGRIGASIAVRDTIVPEAAARLDALAALAIEAFSDRSADGVLVAPGLFVDPDPAGGSAGLAGRIRLAAAFDPREGGSAFALRDGAPGGPAGPRNPGGAAGFSAILIERIEAIDVPRTLDPAAGLGSRASLGVASANQIGLLELRRSEAEGTRQGADAALERAETAHSNAIGVNIDEEMARLVAIEQSYRAAARVMAVAEAMLDDLFAATR